MSAPVVRLPGLVYLTTKTAVIPPKSRIVPIKA
jgi:hypothetical protein